MQFEKRISSGLKPAAKHTQTNTIYIVHTESDESVYDVLMPKKEMPELAAENVYLQSLPIHGCFPSSQPDPASNIRIQCSCWSQVWAINSLPLLKTHPEATIFTWKQVAWPWVPQFSKGNISYEFWGMAGMEYVLHLARRTSKPNWPTCTSRKSWVAAVKQLARRSPPSHCHRASGRVVSTATSPVATWKMLEEFLNT